MTKFTTNALAAAIIGSVALLSGNAIAAAPSPEAAVSSPDGRPTWVKMSKKKMMMMKKKKMMMKKDKM